MAHSFRYLRIALFAICIIVAITGVVFWSWSYTTSRIKSARSIGVFSSPSEGMRSLVDSGWTGVEEARIVRAVPETALGHSSHLWFVIACVWAESRVDGSAVGSSTHDYDYPGSYFVDTKEGWILMPESSRPLFVGFWMKVFGLAGDGEGRIVQEPSRTPACIREAG